MASEHVDEVESPDIHFEPIVQLPQVEVVTMEEEEEELIQLRAKLFRFDSTGGPLELNERAVGEWKERGTGTVKLLRHKKSNLVRVLMRRDKTLKICANHYVQPDMELKPNCGSDRAWVWTTQADFSDDESKGELLAIRFANSENAQKFKQTFIEAQNIMKEVLSLHFVATKTNGPSEHKVNTLTSADDEDGPLKSCGDDGDKPCAKSQQEDGVADKLQKLTVKENCENCSSFASESLIKTEADNEQAKK